MIAFLARVGRWLWRHPKTVLFAVAFAALWVWRRGVKRRVASALAARDRAELERDVALGTAAVSERRAELTADQARADADGAAAAKEIEDVPTTGSPADRVRALDAAARRLHEDEGGPGAVPGHGGAAGLPPRR